jgi:hypothetical protein
MWVQLAKALREMQRAALGEAAGSYRPDLHYMRGPGPKWHAKHGTLAAMTSPPGKGAGSTLHDMGEHRA